TDATYKTNALGYELYSVIGHYNGSGFALAYLFIEGSKKNDVDNNNGSIQIFEKYKSILLDALKIVQEQENANNIQWAFASFNFNINNYVEKLLANT
ncbi:5915_t:CDS:2, partial [Cetraspora pellucida]